MSSAADRKLPTQQKPQSPSARHAAGGLSTADDIFTCLKKGPLKVAVVGGGSFGSAVAKVVSENAAESYIFCDEVKMWCMEEVVDGRKLHDIINTDHINPKYFPDIPLPHNIKAIPNMLEAIEGALLLIFVTPHQYLHGICETLKGKVNPNAKAISCIKGCMVENGKPSLCSEIISSSLGLDCCVLSGANVAKDVGMKQFCETTIGYKDKISAAIWQQLFDRPYFRVNCVPDIHGVELCGALKNVIALAAGFSDGMDLGTNTKAAVMRLGIEELRVFAALFFDGVMEETFFDSSGYADVITSCLGGRNWRCAKEFVKRGCTSTWDVLETEMLNGQKLQGHLACKDVHEIIKENNLQETFPLFLATYNIAFEGAKPSTLLESFQGDKPRRIKLHEECNGCIVPSSLTVTKRRLMSTLLSPSNYEGF